MNKFNIKILLVEDNPIAQMAQKMTLEQEGYHVDVASSGEQAVAFSLKNDYHLILMDIWLDDMDGFEVTKEIKNKSSQNKDTTIVALTAHSAEDYGHKAKSCGIQDFLTKPLTPEKIQELLKNIKND